MRFIIIAKATPEGEAGTMPSPETLEATGKFNRELIDAGVLLAAEGLHPSRAGARVTCKGGRLVARDGPFAETEELAAGFWIITAKSQDEALAWVRRFPFQDGETIELRRVFEATDFAEAVPEGAAAMERAWRDATGKPITN